MNLTHPCLSEHRRQDGILRSFLWGCIVEWRAQRVIEVTARFELWLGSYSCDPGGDRYGYRTLEELDAAFRRCELRGGNLTPKVSCLTLPTLALPLPTHALALIQYTYDKDTGFALRDRRQDSDPSTHSNPNPNWWSVSHMCVYPTINLYVYISILACY